MTDEEQRLYWRGAYFPNELSDEEFEQWKTINAKYNPPPSEEDQQVGSILLFIFGVILAVSAVFL